MLICLQATVVHLLIFNANSKKRVWAVEWTGYMMRIAVPLDYIWSFGVGSILVHFKLGVGKGLPLSFVLICPPLALAIYAIFFTNQAEKQEDQPAGPTEPNGDVLGQGSETKLAGSVPTMQNLTQADVESTENAQKGNAKNGISGDEFADIFNKMFERYDLDGSGLIDSEEELRQLATALVFKLDLDTGCGINEIDTQVQKALDACPGGLSFTESSAREWFQQHFRK